ncbi:TPA: hypothetical protein DCW54_01810 [Candidatus Dependentiae bacterium]|nr:hypothetical protein [Candidatus Dependentiae bacterium]
MMKQILKRTSILLVSALLIMPHQSSAASWFPFGSGSNEKKDDRGWVAKTLAGTLEEPIKALKKTIKTMGEEIPKSLDENIKIATGQLIVSIEDIFFGPEQFQELENGATKKVRTGGFADKATALTEKISLELGGKLTKQLDASSQKLIEQLVEKICLPVGEKLVVVDTMLQNLNKELFGPAYNYGEEFEGIDPLIFDDQKKGIIEKTQDILTVVNNTLTTIDESILSKENIETITSIIKDIKDAGKTTNEILQKASAFLPFIKLQISKLGYDIRKTIQKYQDLKEEVSSALEEYKKLGSSANNFVELVSASWAAFIKAGEEIKKHETFQYTPYALLGLAGFSLFSMPLTSILIGAGTLAYFNAPAIGKDVSTYLKNPDKKKKFEFKKTTKALNQDSRALALWALGGLGLGLFKTVLFR